MGNRIGKLERAIMAAVKAEPNNAFTTAELCARVYRDVKKIEKKHRVAVLRAAETLSGKLHTFRRLRGEHLGGTLVFFDARNVMSYGMARLKADELYDVGDLRVRGWNRQTEESLRAKLAAARHRELITEGGAWWRHVQSWKAEADALRSGDQTELRRVLAERKAADHKVKVVLGIASR